MATVAMALWASALGCEPTQGGGPSFASAVAHDNPWPACISRKMEQQATFCPNVSRAPQGEQGAPAFETASCVRAEPEVWPSTRVPVDISEMRQAMAGRSEALDRAEALFDEAAADPAKLVDAKKAYQRALRREAADPSSGYTAFRLGEVERQLGSWDAAVARFEQATRFAMDRPMTPHAATLEAAARDALVQAQANLPDPQQADERFARVAGVRGERRRSAMTALLGERLAEMGKLREADLVLSALAEVAAHDRCEHRAHLVEVRRLRGLTTATARALDSLLDDVEAMPNDHALRERCSATAAQLAISIGDQWHADSLRTRDKHTMYLASHVYNAVLSTFTQRRLVNLGVCTPLADIAYGRAELLFGQLRWSECGEAYDWAIRYDPRGGRAEDAAFSAVVCRQSAWRQTKALHPAMPQEDRILSSLDHDKDWRALLASIHRYLCMANESQRHTPAYSESAYARAEAFYDGGALWEAAVAFRLVAFGESGAEPSGPAARRYAEVMEDLAADDVCRRELTLDIEKLVGIHCPAAKADASCVAMRGVLGRLTAGYRPQL